MNGSNTEKMERLMDFLVEDILEMSYEEIIAELIEEGLDPAKVAADMREAAERAIAEAKRRPPDAYPR